MRFLALEWSTEIAVTGVRYDCAGRRSSSTSTPGLKFAEYVSVVIHARFSMPGCSQTLIFFYGNVLYRPTLYRTFPESPILLAFAFLKVGQMSLGPSHSATKIQISRTQTRAHRAKREEARPLTRPLIAYATANVRPSEPPGRPLWHITTARGEGPEACHSADATGGEAEDVKLTSVWTYKVCGQTLTRQKKQSFQTLSSSLRDHNQAMGGGRGTPTPTANGGRTSRGLSGALGVEGAVYVCVCPGYAPGTATASHRTRKTLSAPTALLLLRLGQFQREAAAVSPGARQLISAWV
ncbi:hypothetical protein C8Q79DRAFT_924958 [Trametes meyenii]|nr:hypothetical protein C8Q79DRAFT_924958 [Trametes meyenii]